MFPGVDEITKALTGHACLTDCSGEDLQKITSQYPYFGPAQFLLSKKLKEINSSLAESQKQKTSLYFQNPVWLEYILQSSVEKHAVKASSEEFLSDTSVIEAPFTFEPVVDQTRERNGFAGTNGHTFEKEVAPFPAPTDKTVNEEPAAAVKELPEPEINSSVEFTKDAFLNEPDLTVENAGPEPPAPGARRDEKEEFPIGKFKFQPIDPAKAAMTFEPYHTVDYFASQGIKAREEEKAKDRFSLQLKSFTEWLKVMKKLPASELGASVSASDEKNVEQMAATSINDREVVTEAMAAVWEKQQNPRRAIEIYEKLSLLNPSKSAYFAAKIEHLKTL